MMYLIPPSNKDSQYSMAEGTNPPHIKIKCPYCNNPSIAYYSYKGFKLYCSHCKILEDYEPTEIELKNDK